MMKKELTMEELEQVVGGDAGSYQFQYLRTGKDGRYYASF